VLSTATGRAQQQQQQQQQRQQQQQQHRRQIVERPENGLSLGLPGIG